MPSDHYLFQVQRVDSANIIKFVLLMGLQDHKLLRWQENSLRDSLNSVLASVVHFS